MNRLVIFPAGFEQDIAVPAALLVTRFAEIVVDEVRERGPLGYDQEGHRAVGLLREDMRIRSLDRGPASIEVIAGTDPVNPTDGFHYAERVHKGHDGFASSGKLMVFKRRGHSVWSRKYSVGSADPVPFLYDAVDRANLVIGGGIEFILIKT